MPRNRHSRGRPRTPATPRVMRVGKTKRDHASGAWINRRRNKDWRRHEGDAAFR